MWMQMLKMTTSFQKQLRKDLQEFYENLANETRWRTFDSQDKQNELNILLFGAPDTPYENGTFWVRMEFPNTYPLRPPTLAMKTQIFHPIVDKRGKICLSILSEWQHKRNIIAECFGTLYQAMKNPQPFLRDAIDDEALRLYFEDYHEFDNVATKYTQKFAMCEVCNVLFLLSLCVSGQNVFINVGASFFWFLFYHQRSQCSLMLFGTRV